MSLKDDFKSIDCHKELISVTSKWQSYDIKIPYKGYEIVVTISDRLFQREKYDKIKIFFNHNEVTTKFIAVADGGAVRTYGENLGFIIKLIDAISGTGEEGDQP